jgi:hypothetical protein
MKKRLILITSIVAILLVTGIYIKVETQTKPAPQGLTHPYHVKIFRCDMSEYYVTTKENVQYTLDDYLRDGAPLRSLKDGHDKNETRDKVQITQEHALTLQKLGVSYDTILRSYEIVSEINDSEDLTSEGHLVRSQLNLLTSSLKEQNA